MSLTLIPPHHDAEAAPEQLYNADITIDYTAIGGAAVNAPDSIRETVAAPDAPDMDIMSAAPDTPPTSTEGAIETADEVPPVTAEQTTAEVSDVHTKLQERLLVAPYTGDAHYTELNTLSGSLSVTDYQRLDHADYAAAWDTALIDSDGEAFNAEGQSNALLEDGRSIVTITVMDGPHNDPTAQETGHYLMMRPCDVSPDDNALGSFLWSKVIPTATATNITHESTNPILVRMHTTEPWTVVPDIRADPVLHELHTALLQDNRGGAPPKVPQAEVPSEGPPSFMLPYTQLYGQR